MVDVHAEPAKGIIQALVAALLVRPLDPGLTERELETSLIENGSSQAVAREVVRSWLARQPVGRRAKIVITANELWADFRHFFHDYPPELFPLDVVPDLQKAFDTLDAIEGKSAPKTLTKLEVRCPHEPAQVASALGFMIAVGCVKVTEKGYIRVADFLAQIAPNGHSPDHPWVEQIQNLKPILERVFARRADQLVSSSTPLERFGRFLKKQGWNELAQWWTQASHELTSLSPLQPVAITVLAGALLEAALVAIAAPARNAQKWGDPWLNNPPQTWKLGKLVEAAAKQGGPFGPADALLATGISDFRNRIHVGRYAQDWKGPFVPPYTNDHEVRLARNQLNRLLDTILRWPPIAALNQ